MVSRDAFFGQRPKSPTLSGQKNFRPDGFRPSHTTLLQGDNQPDKQLHTIMYKKLP
jgi:hypothetical protein